MSDIVNDGRLAILVMCMSCPLSVIAIGCNAAVCGLGSLFGGIARKCKVSLREIWLSNVCFCRLTGLQVVLRRDWGCSWGCGGGGVKKNLIYHFVARTVNSFRTTFCLLWLCVCVCVCVRDSPISPPPPCSLSMCAHVCVGKETFSFSTMHWPSIE